MRRYLIVILLLVGCSHPESAPHGCRERVTKWISANYPDPNNLDLALNAVCVNNP